MVSPGGVQNPNLSPGGVQNNYIWEGSEYASESVGPAGGVVAHPEAESISERGGRAAREEAVLVPRAHGGLSGVVVETEVIGRLLAVLDEQVAEVEIAGVVASLLPL